MERGERTRLGSSARVQRSEWRQPAAAVDAVDERRMMRCGCRWKGLVWGRHRAERGGAAEAHGPQQLHCSIGSQFRSSDLPSSTAHPLLSHSLPSPSSTTPTEGGAER